MNNKGQTLVLFIALIPFIFVLLVFAIDFAKLSSEKTYIEGIADDSLKSLKEGRSIAEIENIIKENDENIVIEKIDKEEICLSKKINPIFGGVLGVEVFTAKYCAK